LLLKNIFLAPILKTYRPIGEKFWRIEVHGEKFTLPEFHRSAMSPPKFQRGLGVRKFEDFVVIVSSEFYEK